MDCGPAVGFTNRFAGHMWIGPFLGTRKSTQTFFVQSFSRTLRVMDVRAENRGHPHRKVCFSAAPVMGRKFLTQGRPGVRVRNVRGKSGPESLCLCCFSSLTFWGDDEVGPLLKEATDFQKTTGENLNFCKDGCSILKSASSKPTRICTAPFE